MNISEILKEELKNNFDHDFAENLVHMNVALGRDMHNRPPLYEVEFDKIDEIKSFCKSYITDLTKRIIESEIERLEKIECTITRDHPEHCHYPIALTDIISHLQEQLKLINEN